ncbi:MAG: hypothetical protein J6A01_05385 [Proteobacteria bacterium]|nr:hypothetical protein [Pseudomonadota bacterium]
MSKRKLAFLFVFAATLVSCNESVEWGSTKPSSCLKDGDKICGSGAVMICKDGEYVELEKCTADKPVCDPGTFTCIPQSVTCTPACNGNVLTTCDANGTATTTTCSGDTPVCGTGTDGKLACIAGGTPTTCTPGCDGNTLVVCKEDGTKDEDLSKNCEEDSLVCGQDADGNAACVETTECIPGCDGDTLVVCKEDGTRDDDLTKDCTLESMVCGINADGENDCIEDPSNVKCTYGEGEDALEISYDESVCDADGKVMTCQANGTMSEAADCADANQHCVPDEEGGLIGKCVDYAPCTLGNDVVNNGDTACSEGSIVKCEKGEIVADTECNDPEVCMEDTDGTILCKEPGENDCDHNGTIVAEGGKICNAEGTQIQVCTAAEFVDATENACTEDQLCVVVEHVPACVDCVEDVCVDGQIQRCYNGELQEAADCITMFGTTDNAETAVCNEDGNACVIATCVEGYELDSMGKCLEARPGCGKDMNGDDVANESFFCVSETEYNSCSAEGKIEYQENIKCKENQVCNPETINTTFKCEDGTASCTANVCLEGKIQVCEGGVLATAIDCPTVDHATEYNCKDEATCGVAACEAGFKVVDGVSCEEDPNYCTKNVCKDKKLQVCTDNALGDAADCSIDNATEYDCNEAGDACIATECADGYKPSEDGLICETDSDYCTASICTAGKIQVCTDHVLASSVDCSGIDHATKYNCKDDATCGVEECEDGYQVTDGVSCEEIPGYCTASICSDGKIQVCTDHVLAAEAACPTVEHATAYGCKDESTCSVTDCEEGYDVSDDKLSCVKQTVTCVEDTFECLSATQYRICISNSWETDNVTEGTTCNTATNELECVSDKICVTDKTYKECNAGKVSDTVKDVDDYLKCDSNAFVCEQTGTFCDDKYVVTCNAGVASLDQDCSDTNQVCETGACRDYKTCTDAVSGSAVAGKGDIGCMSETAYSVCNDGVWSTATTDVVDCETGKTCDPTSASMECAGGTSPEWTTIIEGPEKYIGGTVVKTPDSEACTDASKPNKITCNNEASNVGTTEPSKECASDSDTSAICQLTASTNPSVDGYSTRNVNKDGYLSIGKTWPGTASFTDNQVKLSLSSTDIAKLSGKTKIRASFDVKAKDNEKSAKKLQIAFFNGDTMIGSAKEVSISTTKATVSSDEVEFSSTTDLNLRITGYESTGGQAVYIYPITIDAQ